MGIGSEEFSLVDCADDVGALIDVLELEEAIVAGYSMGSIVAQRVWRQHGDKVRGLVLCATTDRFQMTLPERAFFTGMGATMLGLRTVARSRTAVHASRAAAQALDLEPRDIEEWALAELRSTSPWAVAQAIAALGRHHSRPWLGEIDVPTAVVVNRRDHVIAPGAPARGRPRDPRRHHPRHRHRPRGLRAGDRDVRAGLRRGCRHGQRAAARLPGPRGAGLGGLTGRVWHAHSGGEEVSWS